MEKQKANRIINIYNWLRFIILALILAFVIIGLTDI